MELGSWWVNAGVLLAIVASYAYYYVKRKWSYFKERGIAEAKPTNILGSLADSTLLRKPFFQAADDIYKAFPEERYVGIYQALDPGFLIRDPELVQRILIKDFSYFSDRGINVNEELNPLDANLFGLSGDKWRTLRHKLTPTFTSGKLKWMFSLMSKCGDQIVEVIEKEVGGKTSDVLIKEIFARYTTDVIASCSFGLDGEAIKDPDCEFRQLAKKIFHPPKRVMLKMMLSFILPKLASWLRLRTQPEEINKFFIDITKQAFEHRKSTGEKRTDFLQLLLELKEKGEIEMDTRNLEEDEIQEWDTSKDEKQEPAKLELTDELLAAQVFVFFLAGLENTASVIGLTAYFLSKNQQTQEAVRREINNAIEKHGELSYKAVKDMKLLTACVDETLRLQTPGEGLIRQCNKTFPIGDGNYIEKNQTVIIPVYSIQRDPKYWERPDDFYPERFLDENKPIVPGTYIPFGDGPRICIALRFAKLEAILALAKVVEKFEFMPSEKIKEPLEFIPGMSQEIKGGIWVKLRPVTEV